MSNFNYGKWIKAYKESLVEKDSKVTLKDLLHTTKVDDKKADKVDVKIGAENDLAIEKDKDGHDVYARGLTEAITKSYQLGDKWSNDFDYVGMLKMGAQTTYELYEANGIEALQDLYVSFEDVNYHSENKFLGYAIDDLEDPTMGGIEIPDGGEERARESLENFRRACMKTLKDMNIKWTPQR
jgi:hypothetical protein|tara:strand:+ start:589 stop:1137 length:549 start_codon:yes stop_codon:yes gene_type:complete